MDGMLFFLAGLLVGANLGLLILSIIIAGADS